MQLELGCGTKPQAGYVNHDRRKHADYVDVAHDLNCYPWPWSDVHFDYIRATDLVEHLDDFIGFFDECWRILKSGGHLLVRVPRWDSINVPIDPTHKRGYHPASFEYLDPTTARGKEKGRLYTTRGWELVHVADDGQNLTVQLRVRK